MPADLTAPDALLDVRGVRGGYGAGDVLHGVDLALAGGEVVALLGPNGAGKSTLLRTIAGFLRPTGGTVSLLGRRIDGRDPAELARCGMYLVPERRGVFPNLSVADNLRLATAAPERAFTGARAAASELFPRLTERAAQLAGTLSGGEQQMLALARAFSARPLVLLLDEPSLGLAPRVVDEVFATIRRFREEGISIVLVEQYVTRALDVADHAVVLQKGRVVWHGPAADADVHALAHEYLGTA
ncbi:MAG TPA: ABC transporter ATP-binding protein [Acidimicrobiales bacterium]|nr:ABC transporter ATP-binding protein [Acidimicrobiales bacterium]